MKGGLIHVTRPYQAERMRVIRNACRHFMTNDQHEITPDEQQAWFQEIMAQHAAGNETTLPFLYDGTLNREPEPFGFGLIREQGGKWWLTGGLMLEWRDKGYGKDLFFELADYVHAAKKETAWLTVWEHNVRAVKAYESLGFVVESVYIDAHAPPVLVMQLPVPR